MTALDVFTYADQPVRTVLVDGEPWFVANDVCAVVGIAKPRDAVGQLDGDERSSTIVDTPGGPQRMSVVNEAGVYSLMLISRSPRVRDFKRWLTHEVLPQIRQTGSYAAKPAELSRRDLALMVIAAEDERDAAVARARELEPPARAWEGLASGAGDYTVTDAAKILCRGGVITGQRRLYAYLDEIGWIFHRGRRWQAMQHAVERGWVVERITGGYFDDLTGERKQGDPQIRVTARGIEQLLQLMAPAGELEVVR